ncbi:hypothetical protein BJ170DRAFT_593433 [Xylariales sp. AK1849]|nr:hypothetical protein BJ170DRAFT_593433 [Xylariales sp. AK1849]
MDLRRKKKKKKKKKELASFLILIFNTTSQPLKLNSIRLQAGTFSIRHIQLWRRSKPLALTFSKTSTWLAMEDHLFLNLLTEVEWEALKKQPRDDNPLEERHGAAPFKIDHSCHLLAGLLQVVGVLAPSPCRTCEKDCGRGATCVISYDHSSIDIAKGACANCLYTSAGKACSFRDSLPQDTADTDTNPELKELEGKGFPTHFAAREAIKQSSTTQWLSNRHDVREPTLRETHISETSLLPI